MPPAQRLVDSDPYHSAILAEDVFPTSDIIGAIGVLRPSVNKATRFTDVNFQFNQREADGVQISVRRFTQRHIAKEGGMRILQLSIARITVGLVMICLARASLSSDRTGAIAVRWGLPAT